MAKMKDLFGALGAICNHAQGILEEAKNIRTMFSAAKEPQMIEAEIVEPEPVKTYTLAEVRAALAEKSAAGHRNEIRNILIRHGAEKLTEVDPAEYPAIMAEAEAIGT